MAGLPRASTSGSPTRATRAPTAARFAWVHDYHLMLLPRLLRERGHDGPIGFFLHVPFPPPELFARLPWREQVLEGLLGADVVAFHTAAYRDNFLRDAAPSCSATARRRRRPSSCAAAASRGGARAPDLDRRRASSRRARPAPASTRRLAALRAPVRRPPRAARRRPARLHEGHPRAAARHRAAARAAARPARRVALLQVAVPSRGEVREYRDAARGRRAGRRAHQRPLHRARAATCPIHYLYRGIPQERLLALLPAADVVLVTPLRDGMNLVAKEFVRRAAARPARRRARARRSSPARPASCARRCSCNPYDIDGTAGMVERRPRARRRRASPPARADGAACPRARRARVRSRRSWTRSEAPAPMRREAPLMRARPPARHPR